MPGKRPAARSARLLLSCEHGGNRIPPPYRGLFRGQERLLASHRGYDPGALELARHLSRALAAPLVYSTVSRLLVELNRSNGHPRLFSPRVPAALRPELLRRFYDPYRRELEARIARDIARGRRVVHLSCHSFTPRLAGEVRRADVGLLYDPKRQGERAFCGLLAARLDEARIDTRKNYPYRGYADGLTTYLRTRFAPEAYVGIEIEVNQKFPRRSPARWRVVQRTIGTALETALEEESR